MLPLRVVRRGLVWLPALVFALRWCCGIGTLVYISLTSVFCCQSICFSLVRLYILRQLKPESIWMTTSTLKETGLPTSVGIIFPSRRQMSQPSRASSSVAANKDLWWCCPTMMIPGFLKPTKKLFLQLSEVALPHLSFPQFSDFESLGVGGTPLPFGVSPSGF